MRVVQPRLRHRLQTDRIGLLRSELSLVSDSDGLRFGFSGQGSPLVYMIGAIYAAATVPNVVRTAVFGSLRRGLYWRGSIGPGLIGHLGGKGDTSAWEALGEDPVIWALRTLDMDAADSRPDHDVIRRQFRQALRDAHPDHGGRGGGCGGADRGAYRGAAHPARHLKRRWVDRDLPGGCALWGWLSMRGRQGRITTGVPRGSVRASWSIASLVSRRHPAETSRPTRSGWSVPWSPRRPSPEPKLVSSSEKPDNPNAYGPYGAGRVLGLDQLEQIEHATRGRGWLLANAHGFLGDEMLRPRRRSSTCSASFTSTGSRGR